ncbi:transporter substrate-binding domain-containing protein [Alphaproteobacteria bacterium]|nr:transporter substrate-binding domain-containing protein [Alphaproteobacteria bacterium]
MSNLVLNHLAPKGFLRVAINMSNFLLVTGKKSNGDPDGVSPDLAKALANELGVDLKLVPFDRPGELADAVSEDIWDIGNIAVEPERAKTITFSSPYALIESTCLVRSNLNINSFNDVDKDGVRIAVAERSAYDLWLTDNITKAELVRAKSINGSYLLFQDNNYEVLAGLRPKLIDELSKVSDCKILDDAFTFVKQCVGFKPGNTEVEIFINNFIKKNVENGFIKELFLKYNVLGKLSLPKK